MTVRELVSTKERHDGQWLALIKVDAFQAIRIVAKFRHDTAA